jgi:hypothetical protein
MSTHLTPVYRCAMDVIEHVDEGDGIGTIADVIDKKAVEPFRTKLEECLSAFNHIRSQRIDRHTKRTTYDLAAEIETLLKQYPKR